MTKDDFEIKHNLQKLFLFTFIITVLILPIVWYVFDFIDNYFVSAQIAMGLATIITVIRIFVQKINVGTNLYGLLIPFIGFYLGHYVYIELKTKERIAYQASFIATSEVHVYVANELEDNYYKPKYEVRIKDNIIVNDVRASKQYKFQISKDDKEVKPILAKIKDINSLSNVEKSNCDALIRIESNKNFLIFFKNDLSIRFKNETDQKAINDLLSFITVHTNGLVDFNASCPE